jgi:hypothetical protein
MRSDPIHSINHGVERMRDGGRNRTRNRRNQIEIEEMEREIKGGANRAANLA